MVAGLQPFLRGGGAVKRHISMRRAILPSVTAKKLNSVMAQWLRLRWWGCGASWHGWCMVLIAAGAFLAYFEGD